MAYDQAKYKALRSLEVDRKTALALSDTSNPLETLTGTKTTIANSTAPDVATLVTNFNALLTELRDRGVIS
jgi:hypothetical protein